MKPDRPKVGDLDVVPRCPTARFDLSELNSTWSPPASDLATGVEFSTAVLFEMQVLRALATDWEQAGVGKVRAQGQVATGK